ncbi:HNH endonuclease [Micromonospora sp. MED01]|uniref:HNH endonuclease n=1 Tax=Micromonospora alfalfae TaxID=2911212 RepID=UPI001EE8ECEC|nr:HNH endonuclease signature motif containing protein [Micromonospora alfalfae]MCG5464839.1 HNH endonuclease [Micromonospora alfalfae]
MAEGRPAVPAQLRRDLLVEAGHRCTIPTCRQPTPLQLEHIEDWAKVQRHEFANMIVLCANCHARKTAGQIDRKSLHQYKANLAVLNNRYGEVERRVLELFATSGQLHAYVEFPGTFEILLMYLLRDGLLTRLPPQGRVQMEIMGVPQAVQYALTDTGRAFVQRWSKAEVVESAAEPEDS